MLVNSVEDLSCQYGTLIQKDERVLILIDVKATGELLAALRYETAKLSGNADNIVKEIAIFDVNSGIRIASERFKALYSGIEIPYIDKAACSCKEDKEFILNIEPSTGAPSIYQESYSNLSIHLLKKRLIAEVSEIEGIKRNEFLSKIDDNAVPFILLKKHWKELEGCFKIGHIRRKDAHFEHYDMPEELLFRNDTLEGLELYISEFVWSFEKDNFIDFIIYPSDLTAALLGHIVASRFVKKPIVAEARRFESGVFGLPTNIINKMRGKNVLLVDDAINTGTTVLQLIGLIKIYGGNVEGIFTITHRSTAELEMILRALVPRIACAYKFNLETFKNESNCELCIYQKNLDSKKDTAATEELRRYLLEELEKNKSRDYRVNG